jgi:hypothetical protein
MSQIKVTMQKTRETKGTYFFQELDADGKTIDDPRDGKIGSLYVRKSSFSNGAAPNRITVTIDTDA